MKLSLNPALVPAHIDGVIVQSDFRISRFSAVSEELRALPRAAPHHRPELELNLVLRGWARYLIGEQHLRVAANQLVWIRPRQNRLLIDASADCLAWVLVFRQRVVRRVCTHPVDHPLRAAGGADILSRRLAVPRVRELSALYSGIPVGAGRDVFNAGLGYALTRSWLAFSAAELGREPSDVHPAVRRAAWLLRDSTEPMNNTALAEACGLSAHRLSRLFKAQMGVSLVDYRNRCRVEQFLARLSAEPEPNLMQTAMDVGFGSYAQFYRVFRRLVGRSPVEHVRDPSRFASNVAAQRR